MILAAIALALSTLLSSGAIGTPVEALRGQATYYPTCDNCAAASGRLQDWLGKGWKGTWVTVSRGDRHINVKLVTGCGCGKGRNEWRVIDLSPHAFATLLTTSERRRGIAAKGVQVVTVTRVDGTLPATDTEGD